MNPQIKAEWLKRLRSGEYKQAKAYLYREGGSVEIVPPGYCCLGILCEIYFQEQDPEFRMELVESKEGQRELKYWKPLGQTAFLPLEVADWAGLDCTDPRSNEKVHETDSVGRTLSNLNDLGRSFNQIADIIERDL